ncbi:3-oxoacyl-ACP reductase family protein [Rhizobium mayense]|uniref:3-oxoacyl-ACP reductase family protein n=1 Tax=Rhizobium mayense TaxID=1312184 RepID=A0ABT7JZG2_9HYPH|nr:3-oxoacyl-ACP reductase family protein [Rhizobium mayense]MDL2401163.1 3-oxoacyl-ACP reductase family protein [Rhizobium mayense]
MSQPLINKVALVTGGSRSIGAGIVRRLSADGVKVAFTYSSSPDKAEALVRDIEAAGGAAIAMRADSADPDAVRAAVIRTVERFGGLDILVNNAGILIRETVDNYDLADFDRMFAVNVRAVFVAAQAAIKHMSEGGRIITVGSVAAERAGFPGASVYSATKGAVAAMTRGLARDLSPRGITVNTIQPGPTLSGMTVDAGEMLKPLLPVGRLGKDTEIAALVAYLCSPEAAFVTGSALTIDGGYLA